MEWLNLWSSWYQVQCGGSGTTAGANTEGCSQSCGVDDEDNDDSSEFYSSDDDLFSDDEYEEYARSKKPRKNQKKKTGGHIDGVSNVLFLKGTEFCVLDNVNCMKWIDDALFYFPGPTGSCKTALVHAAASHCGFKVIELNASHWRSGNIIKKLVSEASQSQRFQSSKTMDTSANPVELEGLWGSTASSTGGNQGGTSDMTLILFDEVDIVFADDQNFHNTIVHLARSSKCPLVLTAGPHRVGDEKISSKCLPNSIDKLISSLRNNLDTYPHIVNVDHPSAESLGNFLFNIVSSGLCKGSLDTTTRIMLLQDCFDLANATHGDVKAALNTLLLLDNPVYIEKGTMKLTFCQWLISEGFVRSSGEKRCLGVSGSLELQVKHSCVDNIMPSNDKNKRSVASSAREVSLSSSPLPGCLPPLPRNVSSSCSSVEESLVALAKSRYERNASYVSANRTASTLPIESKMAHSDASQKLFTPIVLSIEPRFIPVSNSDEYGEDVAAGDNDIASNNQGGRLFYIYGKNFLQRGDNMEAGDPLESGKLASVQVHIRGEVFPATIISDTEIRVNIRQETLLSWVRFDRRGEIDYLSRNGKTIREYYEASAEFVDPFGKLSQLDLIKKHDSSGQPIIPVSSVVSFSVSIALGVEDKCNVLTTEDFNISTKTSTLGQSWIVLHDFRAAEELASQAITSIAREESQVAVSQVTEGPKKGGRLKKQRATADIEDAFIDDSSSEGLEPESSEHKFKNSRVRKRICDDESDDEIVHANDKFFEESNEDDDFESDPEYDKFKKRRKSNHVIASEQHSSSQIELPLSVALDESKVTVVEATVDVVPPLVALLRCLREMVMALDYGKLMSTVLLKLREAKYIEGFLDPVDTSEFDDYLAELKNADKEKIASEGLELMCDEVCQYYPTYWENDAQTVSPFLPLKEMSVSVVSKSLNEGIYAVDVSKEEDLISIESVIMKNIENIGLGCLCIKDIQQQFMFYVKCLIHDFIIDITRIWINSIIYNGNGSDYGKVAMKHHHAFMKSLNVTLQKEYSCSSTPSTFKRISQLLDTLYDSNGVGDDCKDESSKIAEVPRHMKVPSSVPTIKELNDLLASAEENRLYNNGAVLELGSGDSVVASRSVVIRRMNKDPVQYKRHCDEADQLDSMCTFLDASSVGDLFVGLCDRQYNSLDFDLDSSFEIFSPPGSANGGTKDDSSGEKACNSSLLSEASDLNTLFSDEDVMDIAKSKEGSGFNYWETKNHLLFKDCLVDCAHRVFNTTSTLMLSGEHEGFGNFNVLTMSKLLQERISLLNDMCGSNGTKLFRHSTSSCDCRHTVLSKLVIDVIPYILIMLECQENMKNKRSFVNSYDSKPLVFGERQVSVASSDNSESNECASETVTVSEKNSNITDTIDNNEGEGECECECEGELEFDGELSSDLQPRRSTRVRRARSVSPLVDSYLTGKRSRDSLTAHTYSSDIWSNIANALLCPVDMLRKLARLHTLK